MRAEVWTAAFGLTEQQEQRLSEFPVRLLAEGDSWFSLGGLPSSNVLQELRLPGTVVLNLAQPGDRAAGILRHMERLGGGLEQWARRGGASPWTAVLLSVGGNDMIGALPVILEGAPRDDANQSGRWVNEAALAGAVEAVQEAYRRLVAACAGVPVVCHTYDYPVPAWQPALAFGFPVAGPWVMPALEAALVPQWLWTGVVRRLIDGLADGLLALQDELGDFHVVDTRGTLVAAHRQDGGDWENEIHPSAGGYAKVAAKVAERVLALVEAGEEASGDGR